MIRTIVFDMGGVLLRFDRLYFIRQLGVAPEDEQILLDEVFRSVEWVMMDRGAIAEAECEAAILGRIPERLHEAAHKLITMWDRPILPIDGVEALIAELKRNGYGVYLLSNASVRQHEYWPRVPASRYFDGTLISADVKLVKPQPEIYRLFCETFSCKAEECVFIDDLPTNVEGAVYSGWHGVVFRDAKATRKALAALGVNVGV